MRKYTFGALASVALAMTCGVACSSGSTAANDTGDAATCNPCGDDGGGLTVGAGNDSNPDGVPYPAPAGGYGRTARTGSTPGSVIQNFKFLGYPTLTGDGTIPRR